MSLKIGVFGGTFNPPHRGHELLAEHFKKLLQLDRLLIIPTASPPHKQAPQLASGEDRLEMCRRAFPDAEIDDIEIRRGGKSYTVDTLEYLAAQNPGAELYLIIGSDMLLSFDIWYKYERIFELCTVCAAEREADESPIKTKGIPSLFNGHRLIVSDIEPFDISSTEIREMTARGIDTSAFLSPEVSEYIADRGLYRG